MKRFVATLLTTVIGLSTFMPAAMAANEKKAHNIAIGSTAAAAYLLSRHKTRGVGVLAAGGAAYAWKKHHDAVKQRHERENRSAYYRSNSRTRYSGSRTRSSRVYYRNGKAYRTTRVTTRR